MQQIQALLPGAYDLTPYEVAVKGKRVPSLAIKPKLELSTSGINERRDQLHAKLISRVKEHHDRFLAERSIVLPAKSSLKSWHPKFDLDSVPDIEVEKGLEVQVSRIQENQVEKEQGKVVPQAQKAKEIPPSGSKKTSLLERIREKERQAELDSMVGQATGLIKAKDLQVLTLTLESLLQLFAAQRTDVLVVADAVKKLQLSATVARGQAETMECLERLARLLPNHLQLQALPVKVLRLKAKASFDELKRLLAAAL